MKCSLFLVTTLIAVTTSVVAAEKKAPLTIEVLVTVDNHFARDFNPAEERLLDKCMTSTFNEIHGKAKVTMKGVTNDPENAYFASLSHVSETIVETKKEWPAFKWYTSYRWKTVNIAVCTTCPTDCPTAEHLGDGLAATSWVCQNPEKATMLSDAQRFRLHEAERHLEWEAGICDCLTQSDMNSLNGADKCKVTFSPVEDFSSLEVDPLPDQKEDVNENGEDDDSSDGFLHVLHESVVMINTRHGKDVTPEENAFLARCMMDTFNALPLNSDNKMEEAVVENNKLSFLSDFVAPSPFTFTPIKLQFKYASFFWLKTHVSSCGKFCYDGGCPATAAQWMCLSPTKVQLLSDAEYVHYILRNNHNQWEQDMCSCLIEGNMDGFQGMQNCKITFPPAAERALVQPSLRGSTMTE